MPHGPAHPRTSHHALHSRVKPFHPLLHGLDVSSWQRISVLVMPRATLAFPYIQYGAKRQSEQADDAPFRYHDTENDGLRSLRITDRCRIGARSCERPAYAGGSRHAEVTCSLDRNTSYSRRFPIRALMKVRANRCISYTEQRRRAMQYPPSLQATLFAKLPRGNLT